MNYIIIMLHYMCVHVCIRTKISPHEPVSLSFPILSPNEGASYNKLLFFYVSN